MAWKNRHSSQGRASVATDGSMRASVRLLNNVRTHSIVVTVRATVTITGAPTGLANDGDAAALCEFYLNENGNDRCTVDGRVLSFLTDALAEKPMQRTNASALTAGTRTYVSRLILPFAIDSTRYNLVPSETTYAEKDVRAPFTVEAKALPNGFNRLFVGGAGSVDSISIDVEQFHVKEGAGPIPYFIPTIRQTVQSIVANSSDEPLFIKTQNRVRAMVLTQESDLGIQSGIVTALTLRGDNDDIIGPAPVSVDNLAALAQSKYALSTAEQRHLLFYFQMQGRLTNVLNPSNQFTNLRFGLTTDVSGPGTNKRARLTLLELERPADVGGRQLVQPSMPAHLVR